MQTATSLYAVFQRVAERQPARIAATCCHRRLTYAELYEESLHVADRLSAAGVGRGDRVGLDAERDAGLLIGMLGILALGATYVPLDPVLPAARRRFIAEDAGLSAIVAADGVTRLARPPPSERATEAPAYLLYTSGTTGRPKGVPVAHRSVLHLLHAARVVFAFDEHDTWTLFHSYAFDFSVWEIWGALASGARLTIVPRPTTVDPVAFRTLLADEGVTVLNQTPSAFAGLVRAEERAEAPIATLRYVIFGGERLDLERLKPWVARYGLDRPALVNMYGLTESTVHATAHRLVAADFEQRDSVIGAPLPGYHISLREPLGLNGAGASEGEICVAGVGVADGYWNRPELTRERFFTTTLPGQGPVRGYRTGDLARRRGDGTLVYLGRLDTQIKLRGHRIELSEIEATLCAHADVSAAVVVPVDHAADDRRLHAIVEVDREEPGLEARLRAFLRDRLPDYMIPSSIVTVTRIPVTSNGKIDRKRIMSEHANGSDAKRRAYVRGTVLEIARRLLIDANVSEADNFIDAGGHSLLVTKFNDELHRSLGRRADVQKIYNAPLGEVADTLAAGDAPAESAEVLQ